MVIYDICTISTGEFTGFMKHQQYQSLFFHGVFCSSFQPPRLFDFCLVPRDKKLVGHHLAPNKNKQRHENVVFSNGFPGFLVEAISSWANEKIIMPFSVVKIRVIIKVMKFPEFGNLNIGFTVAVAVMQFFVWQFFLFDFHLVKLVLM